MKSINILFALILLLSNCKTSAKLATISQNEIYKNRLGLVHFNCVAAINQNLARETKFTFVSINESKVFYGNVLNKIASSDPPCVFHMEERNVINKENGWFFYQIDTSEDLDLNMGLIIFDDIEKPIFDEDHILLDVNKDGIKEYFHYCNSGEGFIFSIWDGIPYQSNKLWETYYYLAYDMESDCP